MGVMINIKPYQERLELLNEYMCKKIDGCWFNNVIDIVMDKFDNVSMEYVMRIYNQTGIIYFNSQPEMMESSRQLTFDEYCHEKQLIINYGN